MKKLGSPLLKLEALLEAKQESDLSLDFTTTHTTPRSKNRGGDILCNR
jgi:hypothetical protein